MSAITSYTKLREVKIGRVKRDLCQIVLVFAENMNPMDLTGRSPEILFITGDQLTLTLAPTQIDGPRAVFDMADSEKDSLYSLYSKVAIRLDNETVAEGTFSWVAQYDEKSETGNAIGINVNTVEESVEWFPVMVGPRGEQGEQGIQGIQGIQGEQGIQGIQGIQGPTGKSAYQYATESSVPFEGTEGEFAVEMARLPEYANQAQGYKNEAADFASSAGQDKLDAQSARVGAEGARDEVNTMKDSFIRNSTDIFGEKVTEIVSLTQAEYDALPLKINTTLYVITAAPIAGILQVVSLTQAEYDALAVKDNQTLYLIAE